MKKSISISGMKCNHCVMHVTEALRKVPGVSDVVVNLAAGTATVNAEASVTDEALKAAIADVGYAAVQISAQ